MGRDSTPSRRRSSAAQGAITSHDGDCSSHSWSRGEQEQDGEEEQDDARTAAAAQRAQQQSGSTAAAPTTTTTSSGAGTRGKRKGAYTEEERRSRRRLANRDSARRMRAKRGVEVQALEDNVQKLTQRNKALTQQNAEYARALTALQDELGSLRGQLGSSGGGGGGSHQQQHQQLQHSNSDAQQRSSATALSAWQQQQAPPAFGLPLQPALRGMQLPGALDLAQQQQQQQLLQYQQLFLQQQQQLHTQQQHYQQLPGAAACGVPAWSAPLPDVPPMAQRQHTHEAPAPAPSAPLPSGTAPAAAAAAVVQDQASTHALNRLAQHGQLANAAIAAGLLPLFASSSDPDLLQLQEGVEGAAGGSNRPLLMLSDDGGGHSSDEEQQQQQLHSGLPADAEELLEQLLVADMQQRAQQRAEAQQQQQHAVTAAAAATAPPAAVRWPLKRPSRLLQRAATTMAAMVATADTLTVSTQCEGSCGAGGPSAGGTARHSQRRFLPPLAAADASARALLQQQSCNSRVGSSQAAPAAAAAPSPPRGQPIPFPLHHQAVPGGGGIGAQCQQPQVALSVPCDLFRAVSAYQADSCLAGAADGCRSYASVPDGHAAAATAEWPLGEPPRQQQQQHFVKADPGSPEIDIFSPQVMELLMAAAPQPAEQHQRQLQQQQRDLTLQDLTAASEGLQSLGIARAAAAPALVLPPTGLGLGFTVLPVADGAAAARQCSVPALRASAAAAATQAPAGCWPEGAHDPAGAAAAAGLPSWDAWADEQRDWMDGDMVVPEL